MIFKIVFQDEKDKNIFPHGVPILMKRTEKETTFMFFNKSRCAMLWELRRKKD